MEKANKKDAAAPEGYEILKEGQANILYIR